MSSLSRFNPKDGIADFWQEFRKPNPLRWPILCVSTMPLMVIAYWLAGETHYRTPARPSITYITTFDPTRSDAEIAASNAANQEVQDLREQAEEEVAERKREIYKALGKGIGMDVDSIEAKADARRAAEEAAKAERLEEALTGDENDGAAGPPTSTNQTQASQTQDDAP